jgi:putative RNA 2'-phosphotransferase
MNQSNTDISKFLSFVLRHKPEAIGLHLDSEGWAEINDLISCAGKDSVQLNPVLIKAIVDSSEKKRFALSADNSRIRAVQGHSSTQVDINYEAKTPPEFLYHGTATRFLDAIFQEGLIAGSRQYVHLSANEATAVDVGQRHGKPVVLKVAALTMHDKGFVFYQADNGVWLTKSVPQEFLNE